jgi:uncharacterized protein YbbC (DUF1343 family)
MELQFYFLQVEHVLYPKENVFALATTLRMKMFDDVLGTDKIRKKFIKRFSVDDIHVYLNKDVDSFRKLSRKYLIYPYDIN